MYTYKQEDFYSTENIEARMSAALGSDQWKELKATSIGKNILAAGSNIVHQSAMAFFTGLNQMFKSTVTLSGYLEEIAKSNGVIPKTFISANLSMSLRSTSGVKNYAPMDFMLEIGGYKFYNIEDITIGEDPVTIVLHEGNVVRQASVAGTPAGSLWSYNSLPAALPIRVGERVVRRYLLLPKETFVSSIVIESGTNYQTAFSRWQQVQYWYLAAAEDRAWLLQKDFLGRYRIEFGDGTQGREFPTNEVLGVRYLLSSGADVQVDSLSSYSILFQDTLDITDSFGVVNISDVVEGTSDINQDDIQSEIEVQQSTRNALIKESDHISYLESRADVLYANLLFERKSESPSIELFNTVKYAIKPNTEDGKFNDADIKVNLYRRGLDQVDYVLSDSLQKKFNIKVAFSVLDGYVFSNVATIAETNLNSAFDWQSLNFEEKLYTSRVYDIVKDVEGVDVSTLNVNVEAVHVDNEVDGDTVFDFSNGIEIDLDFIPKRNEVYLDIDEAVRTARDDGNGELWADILGREKFDTAGAGLPQSTVQINNFLFMTSGQSAFRVIDLNRDSAAVSTLNVLNTVRAASWVDRYNELVTVEDDAGNYFIRTYKFLGGFFDSNSFNYLQLKGTYSFTSANKELDVTPPANTNGVYGVAYFNSYLYIVWKLSTGNHRLVRYRITNDSIDAADSNYNSGDGYLELSSAGYFNIVITEGIFGDESVLWIAADDGIDAVRNFDDVDDCFYSHDFFASVFVGPTYSPPINWYCITADTIGNLYGVRLDGANFIVTKLQQVTSGGSCVPVNMSDSSIGGIYNISFYNYGGELRVYFYSASERKLYYLEYTDEDEAPKERAGTTLGNVDSLLKVADVDYINKLISFLQTGTNATLWYKSDEELIYGVFDMAVLNDVEVSNL